MASRLILRRKMTPTPPAPPAPEAVVYLSTFREVGPNELFSVNKYPGEAVYMKVKNGWAQLQRADGNSGSWRKFNDYDGVFRCEVISVKE